MKTLAALLIAFFAILVVEAAIQLRDPPPQHACALANPPAWPLCPR